MRTMGMIMVLAIALGLCACDKSKQNKTNNKARDTQVLHEFNLKLSLPKGKIYRFCRREAVDLKEKDKTFTGKVRKFWYEIDYTVTCLDVYDDGTMLIEKSWDAGRAEGVGKGGRFEWDTQNKKFLVPDEIKQYAKLIGKKITFEIGPTGEIYWIENCEVIADAILYAKGIIKLTADPETYESMREMIMDQVWATKEYMFECGLASYPVSVLKSGDRWEVQKATTTAQEGVEVYKLTFDQVANGIATFDVLISARADSASMGATPAEKVKSEINAWASGRLEMDADTGLIVGHEVKGDLKIQANVEDRLWQVKYEQNMEGTISQSLKKIP
ncbi:MAG: hypothetical protein JW860_14660 [Sedimentisphaerales bacterium]|nr:hypothetical protein [Sedimentisphaerales bacterium]